MNKDYFCGMTNKELFTFYELWDQASETGMMKQDPIVTKAINYYGNISKIPVVDCEWCLLREIAERWNELMQFKRN